MTWIHLFSHLGIPFCIYKLNSGDSIIHSNDINNNKNIIILHGTLNITQVFTNHEILPIVILHKNNIIDNNYNFINYNYKSYYKIIAIEKTYIVSFSSIKFKNNHNINTKFFNDLINAYQMTLNKHENMRKILTHKYTKLRVIQLIIFLCIEFGKIDKTQIKLPFIIKKTDIAIMTGTNVNTVNKILKQLHKNQLIYYSTKNFIKINNHFIIHYLSLLN